MIPTPFRFHGHNSLRYVYAHGKAVRSQALTIKWVKNPRRSHSRISVVVSKKVLKSAVGRNRIRRRLYEYMRHRLPSFYEVFDVVLIATSPELRTMPFEEFEAQLDSLLTKSSLFKADKN